MWKHKLAELLALNNCSPHTMSKFSCSCNSAAAADVARSANTRLQLRLDGGKTDITWPKASGAFTFLNVPEGSHLLDVVAIDVLYPQVRPSPDRASGPHPATISDRTDLKLDHGEPSIWTADANGLSCMKAFRTLCILTTETCSCGWT